MPDNLTLRIALQIQREMLPLLVEPERVRQVSDVTMHKTDEHTAHRIDALAEAILQRRLAEDMFLGMCFSEESGWSRFGDGEDVLVCDPYCNTTLTFHGMRESAVAASLLRPGSNCQIAVADLQMRRVAWLDDGLVRLSTVDGDNLIDTRVVQLLGAGQLADAFVVISTLKRKRRATVPIGLWRRPRLVTAVDGAINVVRLLAGEVDAFVDPVVGQPLYELMGYEMVRRAGGVVTDVSGNDLTMASLVDALRSDQNGRSTVVASANPVLHAELLELCERIEGNDDAGAPR
jgi:fructose-1,6-bisphosphatase/inositol monophosphatase family enzyme